ncbi:MAG: hybrid sensor histidine kinase/response regulator, partial [Nitrospirae bacterium]
FSTALQTGEISGRGVGLDVVKETINELNGTISVATAEGKGTVFRIRVPLTLVIVNVVKFLAGGIEFVIPSSLISELTEINQQLLEAEEREILLRGVKTKVVDLTKALGLQPERYEPTVPAIVVSPLPGLSMALVVDRVLGQEDTVIRPLGRFLEGIRFYSGVSISADGRLMPVLNPATVVDLMEAVPERPVLHTSSSQEPFILVVDDSLSVRKYLEAMLQKRGYKVLSATNGLEALNLLYEKPVSMVITDLEMPVMHGYELLREMKRRGLSEFIPAVVLTSRSSQKHMEKAEALGAQGYLVKPVDEGALMDAVRRFTGQGISS